MKPTTEHLVEVAFHCATSVKQLVGQELLEAELLEARELSFRSAIAGLPEEDIESIHNYIRFVRAERRRRRRAEP